MKYAANGLLALIFLAPVGCKLKSEATDASGASAQQAGKHLVTPANGFRHKMSCAFEVGQKNTPPVWQSATEIDVARKQVESLLTKLGSLQEYKVCVDVFVKENQQVLKLDSKNCVARECAPPVTGAQRLSNATDAEAQSGNFVSRTTVYFNDKTQGEKEQTSMFLSEAKIQLTWRITDDLSRPDFKVEGKELAAWSRQNSDKVCASIRRSLAAGLDRDQIFRALSDDFRAFGLDDQEAAVVAELVNDEKCRWQ